MKIRRKFKRDIFFFRYTVFKTFTSNNCLLDVLVRQNKKIQNVLIYSYFFIKTAVLNDLQTVSAAFAEKPSVADFFTNPFVPQNEKLAALEAVAGETGMAQAKFKIKSWLGRYTLFKNVINSMITKWKYEHEKDHYGTFWSFGRERTYGCFGRCC